MVSIAWMGVDLSALVMILEAWFHTLFAFSKLDFVAVSKEKILNSRTASNVEFLLYAVISTPECPRECLHKCHVKFCLCGTLFNLTLQGHSGIEHDSKVCGCPVLGKGVPADWKVGALLFCGQAEDRACCLLRVQARQPLL